MIKEIHNIAIEIFGNFIVYDVIKYITKYDVETIWMIYIDRNMKSHIDCLEFLYLT